MARLGEPFGEKFTLNYLRQYYSSRYEAEFVFAKTQGIWVGCMAKKPLIKNANGQVKIKFSVLTQ